MSRTPLIEAKGLGKHFAVSRGPFKKRAVLKAVDGVSFSVGENESFAIVGESGCGKTTLGRLLCGLEAPTEGSIFFGGTPVSALKGEALRGFRSRIQPVFQDPFASLNPRMSAEQAIIEPWIIHGLFKDPARRSRELKRLCDLAGIADFHLPRYPHELSGGQKQRICIARALALQPRLLVADEPVSALDVSIQAQIINLLNDLRRSLKLALVFISHDFSVVRQLADRIAVMYLGKFVETASADDLLSDPRHPYTEALLAAVPRPDPGAASRRTLPRPRGDIPDPASPPPGCVFHPRCPYALPACRAAEPFLAEVSSGHWAACPAAPFARRKSAAGVTAIIRRTTWME